jgi:hypothetical protein
MVEYYALMYENGKWDLLKVFQEWGREDKGEWWKGWTQLWYIVRTFANATIYPSTTIKSKEYGVWQEESRTMSPLAKSLVNSANICWNGGLECRMVAVGSGCQEESFVLLTRQALLPLEPLHQPEFYFPYGQWACEWRCPVGSPLRGLTTVASVLVSQRSAE